MFTFGEADHWHRADIDTFFRHSWAKWGKKQAQTTCSYTKLDTLITESDCKVDLKYID